MSRLRIPAWLRRGFEAGAVAALLSLVTVVVLASEGRRAGPLILPGGLEASLVLALPVLSLGVLAVAYPVAMAATRGDAILGAITGWIVGADLLALATVIMGQRLLLLGPGTAMPFGIAAGLLAAPAALGGLLAGILFTPLGFGRRAGRIAALSATAIATAVLVLLVPLVA